MLYIKEPPSAWGPLFYPDRVYTAPYNACVSGPFIPEETGVNLMIEPELGSQGIQSGLDAFKMFRSGSQILRMCGILGNNFEAP